jgi:molybdate transport system substrate-binding protein
MGIAEQIAAKTTQIAPGLAVSDVLARGEGELGFTQVSELLGKSGINYVGSLSADVQRITVFSAGIPVSSPKPLAAKAWVRFLAAPEAAPAFKEYGLDPR